MRFRLAILLFLSAAIPRIAHATEIDAGIYQAPLLLSSQTTTSWAPTQKDCAALRSWSPSPVARELKYQGTADACAELRVSRGPVVAILGTRSPVADTTLEFEYRIPDSISAREININLRTTDNSKLYGLRLPPAPVGQWQRETLPLASIVGGDLWRLSALRTASSIELALVPSQGPAAIQFRSITLTRHISPWGSLPIPQLISLPASGAQRTFSITATPRQSWLQIIASTPVEVIVNGHNLGQAALKNQDASKWPSVPLPVAREFSIDGLLRTDNENTVVIRPASTLSATTPASTLQILCALGYDTPDTRCIIVSDSNWTTLPAPALNNSAGTLPPTPLIARTYKGNEPARWGRIPDIYPLREPQAWSTRSTPSPIRNTLASPSRAPVSASSTPWRTAAPGTGQNPTTRWQLVTPAGHSLYFLGIQTLGLLPNINYRHYRSMMERYPDESHYIDDTLATVSRLGFNGISPAATTAPFHRAARQAGLYHFQYLGPEAGGPWLKNRAGREERHLADPFDEGWRARYRAEARRFAAEWGNNPALIGLFVNNEIPLDGSVNGGSVIGYIYSPACRAAFVRWLADRYGNDLEKLRAAWAPELPASASLSDFTAAPDLDPASARKTPSPKVVAAEDGHAAPRQAARVRGIVETDLYDFAVYAMGIYAGFMLETLRAELPGKLIASNRFMGNATDEMLAAWKNYDLIAWNAYPFSKWQAATYSPAQLDILRRVHRITGRPVIISETGLQALDARLPNPTATLYTQKQRGEEYANLLRQVYDQLPFVVGFILFGWQNLSDTERQSWGIVDDAGNPYTDYFTAVERANKALLRN
ncbi:glycoside hydrolase family 42 [Opitutaceae bacterium TAV5]|nr:glycoside hydrolase family 42 [Opitutaceae bacterium TAV5]